MHGGSWSSAQNETAYETMDKNGDGMCTIEEFLDFYSDVISQSSDEQFERGMQKVMESANSISKFSDGQRSEVEAIAAMVPPSQDRIAGTELAGIVARHNSSTIVETVHAY